MGSSCISSAGPGATAPRRCSSIPWSCWGAWLPTMGCSARGRAGERPSCRGRRRPTRGRRRLFRAAGPGPSSSAACRDRGSRLSPLRRPTPDRGRGDRAPRRAAAPRGVRAGARAAAGAGARRLIRARSRPPAPCSAPIPAGMGREFAHMHPTRGLDPCPRAGVQGERRGAEPVPSWRTPVVKGVRNREHAAGLEDRVERGLLAAAIGAQVGWTIAPAYAGAARPSVAHMKQGDCRERTRCRSRPPTSDLSAMGPLR